MSSGSEFISNVSNRHEAPAIMTGNEVTFPKPANPGAFGVIYVNNLTGEAFIYTRTGWIPFAGGGGGGLTAANNGLYVSDGNTVRLGTNPLLEDTTIDLDGFLLSMGNDGNAALVLAPATGISRLGAFSGVTNNTYITVDDTIQAIKLNVDSGGGAFTQGIALDGVNDSYKFGNTNNIALEIIGGTQTIQTFATGGNFGINVDFKNGYTALGDLVQVFNNNHTNLFIDSQNQQFYFSDVAYGDTLFLNGYETSTYSYTLLGDPSGLYNNTYIGIYSGINNDLINFLSISGNYIFNNIPTYANNTEALAGGLVTGNIYTFGATLGAASLLAIVY